MCKLGEVHVTVDAREMSNHYHLSIEDGGGRSLHHRRTGPKPSSSKLRRSQVSRRKVSHSRHIDGSTRRIRPWRSRRKSRPLCPPSYLRRLQWLRILIAIAALTILAIRLLIGIKGSTNDDFVVWYPLSSVYKSYMSTLSTYPLMTKMLTGAALATAGDGIAQAIEDNGYSPVRGASFAVFEMMYCCIRHWVFPSIAKLCRGRYLAGVIGIGQLFDMSKLKALERALASQLILVPLLYYPLFFTFTGYIQGLNYEEGLDRAKQNFMPLLKRNLLFGIPVQYVQFCYVPKDLQIPFLSCAGIVWIFLLSVYAGSAKKHSTDEPDHGASCVIGSQSGCVILIPEEQL